MAQRKRKTVFTAEVEQFEEIQRLVRGGRFRSTSEFLRAAVDDKLMELRRTRLAEQVARYCGEGDADEDVTRGLVDSQAFEDEP